MKIKKNKNTSPENYHFNLKEDDIYIVYALAVFNNDLWYCISEGNNVFFPMWNPSILFDIVDSRLSRYWIFGINEDNNKKLPILTFPEWANDPYFYSELVEYNGNDPNAIIFKKYKSLMDLEFPDQSISEIAEIGDNNWLICPKCIDAWKCEEHRDALVICPECQTIFNNPRYRNEFPHLSSDK